MHLISPFWSRALDGGIWSAQVVIGEMRGRLVAGDEGTKPGGAPGVHAEWRQRPRPGIARAPSQLEWLLVFLEAPKIAARPYHILQLTMLMLPCRWEKQGIS
jgi:hypothetical protein